jgi:hypothetical protein
MFISSVAADRGTPSCDIATYNHSVIAVPHRIYLGVCCIDASAGSEAAVDSLGHLTEFCFTSCHYCVHYRANLRSSPSQCCEYLVKYTKGKCVDENMYKCVCNKDAYHVVNKV